MKNFGKEINMFEYINQLSFIPFVLFWGLVVSIGININGIINDLREKLEEQMRKLFKAK